MKFTPVAPGWVLVPAKQQTPNEWYHVVGWTEDLIPVIALPTGIKSWTHFAGTDAYCIATHYEWVGGPAC